MAFEVPRDEDFRCERGDMGAEKWIDVDGIRTRYFDQGEGSTVVFFHGGQFGSNDGCSARAWDFNFIPLSSYLNVIAVDRLGQGFTGNPKTDADYTMHSSVQHAARFLQILGKGPYHVVGHSRGGYLVTRLALEYPQLVASCVPVSNGTLSPGMNRTHIIDQNYPTWSVRAALRQFYEVHSYNPRIVTEGFLDEPEKILSSERHKLVRKKMDEGLARKVFYPGLARQRAETHRWLRDRGLPCPTLVVWGYNDPAADFELGKQLIEMYMEKQRNTEVALFNRSGHFVFREYPAQFNRALHAFVMSNC